MEQTAEGNVQRRGAGFPFSFLPPAPHPSTIQGQRADESCPRRGRRAFRGKVLEEARGRAAWSREGAGGPGGTGRLQLLEMGPAGTCFCLLPWPLFVRPPAGCEEEKVRRKEMDLGNGVGLT